MKNKEGRNLPGISPSSMLPRWGGEHYETNDIGIDFYPALEYELYLKAPQEIITFTYGNQPAYGELAIESDVFKKVRYLPATICFLPQGSITYTRMHKIPDIRTMALNYSPELRQTIMEEMSTRMDPSRILYNLAPSHPEAKLLSQSLYKFMMNGFQGGKLIAESLVRLAIVQTIETVDETRRKKTNTVPVLSGSRLNRTLEYIEVNIEQNLGLRELANIANLSVYHFSRCFKNAVGLTPYAYLLSRRIERAKHLLAHTSMPLIDIALSCGFSSQGHLSVVFKKHTGITPLRYRIEAQR